MTRIRLGRGRTDEERVDRRALFFVACAIVCLLLVPEAGRYTWVAWTVAGVYLVFAAASWLETWSNRRP